MKRWLIVFAIFVMVSPAFAQKDLATGYRYSYEEFVFFHWDSQQPLTYVFEVTTSYDGPHIIRYYRAWYGLNGEWRMVMDEQIDNEKTTETPLDDALNIRKTPDGHLIISFKHQRADLVLHVNEQLTSFEVEAASREVRNELNIYQAVLENNGVNIEGIVVHTDELLRDDNPLITTQLLPRFGQYDRVYLFTRDGDVLVTGRSDVAESVNQTFLWEDGEKTKAIGANLSYVHTVTDSVTNLEYPVIWNMELPGQKGETRVENIGSAILFGHPEKRSDFDMMGLFTVRGVMSTNAGRSPVFGLVKHIKD